MFFVLSGIIVMLMISYAYFVNETVLNIVARKNIDSSMTALSSEVSEYEFEYMEYKNTITLDFANTYGFNESSRTTFISRAPQTTQLTFSE